MHGLCLHLSPRAQLVAEASCAAVPGGLCSWDKRTEACQAVALKALSNDTKAVRPHPRQRGQGRARLARGHAAARPARALEPVSAAKQGARAPLLPRPTLALPRQADAFQRAYAARDPAIFGNCSEVKVGGAANGMGPSAPPGAGERAATQPRLFGAAAGAEAALAVRRAPARTPAPVRTPPPKP